MCVCNMLKALCLLSPCVCLCVSQKSWTTSSVCRCCGRSSRSFLLSTTRSSNTSSHTSTGETQAQTDTQRIETLSLGLQQQLERLLDVQMYVMTLKASQQVSSFRLKTLSPDVLWHGNSGALTSS